MAQSGWQGERGFAEVRLFDADQAASATPGVNLEFSPRRLPLCSWRVQEASLGESRLVTGKWPTGLVADGVTEAETVAFAFGVNRPENFTINARALGPDEIAFMPERSELAVATDTHSRWAAVQISRPVFEREMHVHSGHTRTAANSLCTLRPGNARQQLLRLAFRSAIDFAAEHRGRLQDASVSRRLHRKVLDQLLRCIDDSPVERHIRHAPLIRKMGEYLEHHRDDVVEQWDLCKLLSIGDRSLRRLFADTYRTSPGRYLRVRRLNQARRLLRDGAAQSVTDVAIRLGFFDVGRFAADFRAYFGELPSAYLYRQRE